MTEMKLMVHSHSARRGTTMFAEEEPAMPSVELLAPDWQAPPPAPARKPPQSARTADPRPHPNAEPPPVLPEGVWEEWFGLWR